MKIGIQVNLDLKQQTGVGEYTSQMIKHLMMLKQSKEHQFFLYTPKTLKWPFQIGWTQIRLSWGMLKNKPDVLFVPNHTFPLFSPKRTIITIQGLEYEAVPQCYSLWQRKKLRFLTKRNIKKAYKIIVPSQNTKKDLFKFYPNLFKAKVDKEKVRIIYHGVTRGGKIRPRRTRQQVQLAAGKKDSFKVLYLGSNHSRKNIEKLKEAHDILLKKYSIKSKLILIGVKNKVSAEEKEKLFGQADLFVFPSLYEGFGFPPLEAQARKVPVIVSDSSSLSELFNQSARLIDPYKPEEIARAMFEVLNNEKLKEKMIKKGYSNSQRFDWNKCAQATLKTLCE